MCRGGFQLRWGSKGVWPLFRASVRRAALRGAIERKQRGIDIALKHLGAGGPSWLITALGSGPVQAGWRRPGDRCCKARYQLGAHYVTSEPLLTLTELATTTRYVTTAVKIPVIVDAGAGFGEPLHVMRCVRELERAGAAGLHIEDQIYPKRAHYHKGIEHVVPREEMVAKIRAALAARTDPDFVIMARTDAMHADGFAEGVARANRYLEEGAEMVMIFPDTEKEARQAPREIRGGARYPTAKASAARPLSRSGIRGNRYKLSTSHRSLPRDAGTESRDHHLPQGSHRPRNKR